jgi:hypothetical protein
MSLRLVVAMAFVLVATQARAGTGYWLPKKASKYVPPCLGQTSRLDLAPDGIFRCDALPAQVTFPMGFEVRALDDRHSATLITVHPGGALAFHYTVTTWRPTDANITAEIDTAQDAMLRQMTIIDGVKVLGHAPAKLKGAPVGRAVTFTDRQGKLRGEMRTFIRTGWGISLISFGNDGDLLGPSGAIARAFFDSVRMVDPKSPPDLKLSDQTLVRLPAGAYPLPRPEGAPYFFLLPGVLAHMAVFDGGPTANCKAALTQARSPQVMQQLIQAGGVRSEVHDVRAVGDNNNRWRGELGSRSGPGVLAMVGLIHCASDERLVMVQLNGEGPVTALEPLLDVVAASVGAGR